MSPQQQPPISSKVKGENNDGVILSNQEKSKMNDQQQQIKKEDTAPIPDILSMPSSSSPPSSNPNTPKTKNIPPVSSQQTNNDEVSNNNTSNTDSKAAIMQNNRVNNTSSSGPPETTTTTNLSMNTAISTAPPPMFHHSTTTTPAPPPRTTATSRRGGRARSRSPTSALQHPSSSSVSVVGPSSINNNNTTPAQTHGGGGGGPNPNSLVDQAPRHPNDPIPSAAAAAAAVHGNSHHYLNGGRVGGGPVMNKEGEYHRNGVGVGVGGDLSSPPRYFSRNEHVYNYNDGAGTRWPENNRAAAAVHHHHPQQQANNGGWSGEENYASLHSSRFNRSSTRGGDRSGDGGRYLYEDSRHRMEDPDMMERSQGEPPYHNEHHHYQQHFEQHSEYPHRGGQSRGHPYHPSSSSSSHHNSYPPHDRVGYFNDGGYHNSRGGGVGENEHFGGYRNDRRYHGGGGEYQDNTFAVVDRDGSATPPPRSADFFNHSRRVDDRYGSKQGINSLHNSDGKKTTMVIGGSSRIHVPRAMPETTKTIQESNKSSSLSSVFRGTCNNNKKSSSDKNKKKKKKSDIPTDEDEENSKLLLSLKTPPTSFDERDRDTNNAKNKNGKSSTKSSNSSSQELSPEGPPRIQHSHHNQFAPHDLFFGPQGSIKNGQSPKPNQGSKENQASKNSGTNSSATIEMNHSFSLFGPSSFDSLGDIPHYSMKTDSFINPTGSNVSGVVGPQGSFPDSSILRSFSQGTNNNGVGAISVTGGGSMVISHHGADDDVIIPSRSSHMNSSYGGSFGYPSNGPGGRPNHIRKGSNTLLLGMSPTNSFGLSFSNSMNPSRSKDEGLSGGKDSPPPFGMQFWSANSYGAPTSNGPEQKDDENNNDVATAVSKKPEDGKQSPEDSHQTPTKQQNNHDSHYSSSSPHHNSHVQQPPPHDTSSPTKDIIHQPHPNMNHGYYNVVENHDPTSSYTESGPVVDEYKPSKFVDEDGKVVPYFYFPLRKTAKAFRNCTFLLPGLKKYAWDDFSEIPGFSSSSSSPDTMMRPHRPESNASVRSNNAPGAVAADPVMSSSGPNTVEERERQKAEFIPKPSNTPKRMNKMLPEQTEADAVIAYRRVTSAICAFGGTRMNRKPTSQQASQTHNNFSIFRTKPSEVHSTTSSSSNNDPHHNQGETVPSDYEKALPQRYYENENHLSWEFEEEPPIKVESRELSSSAVRETVEDTSSIASTPKRKASPGKQKSSKKAKTPTSSSSSSPGNKKSSSSGDSVSLASPGSTSRSDQPKMKYRCKLCGQPKQNHICPYQQKLQRSIGTMVYPAVNAFTSNEPGVLAAPLSEMNNFVSLGGESSSNENSPARYSPGRSLRGGAMKNLPNVTPESLHSAMDQIASPRRRYPHNRPSPPHHHNNSPGSHHSSVGTGSPHDTPYRPGVSSVHHNRSSVTPLGSRSSSLGTGPAAAIHNSNSYRASIQAQHGITAYRHAGKGESPNNRKKRNHSRMSNNNTPEKQGSSNESSQSSPERSVNDKLFVETMELKPEQYRIVTPPKLVPDKSAGNFVYPPLPLPFSQRKRLSDNLFALSKEVPQLTDECAVVLREAREKDMWDQAVAELMTQVVTVIHCPDGDYRLNGLKHYLLTLGIAC